MKLIIQTLRAAIAALMAITVAGCAVGPDFQRPAAPAVSRYTPQALPQQTASVETGTVEAQHFADGQDIPAQWWTLFHLEPLNELITSALKANADLKAAEAALRGAQENVAVQRGVYFPSISAQLNPTRQSVAGSLASPAASGNNLYSLHTTQLNIAYVPDVFGGNRRQVESLGAQAEAQRFQLEAAYLTLSANIAVAAIQEASLRAQIKATRDIVTAATRQLELMRKQRAAGQIGGADIAAQETALAQAEAALPPLEKQLALQRDLLAVLAGRFPSEDNAQQFELTALALPSELPVSLPARLVEQRPDVRAAEAQLHAAGAQIGVAIANRLPNITLTASAGSAVSEFSHLFRNGTGFWSLGLDLVQPIFQGGTLLHRQRAAEAAYDQAAAQYRSTVLLAFQNVADALHAIQFDANALKAAAAAERAAGKSLAIARRQWALGAVGYLAVLTAEQAYRQSEISLVQVRASRLADTVALFHALGGGWWNKGNVDVSSAQGK